MMPLPPLATLRLAGACVAGLLLFAAGFAVEHWRLGREIASIQSAHEAQARYLSEDAVARLQAANVRGDALALSLADRDNQLTQIHQEKDREIHRLTVGRRCLDSAAVRVLNQPAGDSARMPAPASEPVQPAAAFATDSDVGSWIAGCQRAYDGARERFAALADFYKDEGK